MKKYCQSIFIKYLLSKQLYIIIKSSPMIQNLTNILKFPYFSQSQPFKRSITKQAKKPRHRHHHNLSQCNIKNDHHLSQLITLIESEEPIERWYIQFELQKDNYYIKEKVYHSFIAGKITIHNLFLMLVQFKIFDQSVWLPIDKLCQLKGGRKNQLCCLIHFTVTNMVGKYGENQLFDSHQKKKRGTWPREKAKREMGSNFVSSYPSETSLEEKIAILPMLIILNHKNSEVLWENLPWLSQLPNQMVMSIRSNMQRLLEQCQNFEEGDQLAQKIFLKSIQLSQVQGFVSHQNLFKASYELYNFSQLLQFLSDSRPSDLNRQQSYRLMVHSFTLELFDCFRQYEYDVTKNLKDFSYLVKIIIDNKLYLEELNDKHFLNQYLENIIACYAPKNIIQQYKNKLLIAGLIPRCSSANHIKQEYFLPASSLEHSDQKSQYLQRELKYKQLLGNVPESILTNILNQLYQLRPEYLETLSLTLRDSYSISSTGNIDEVWSEASSQFYKMQLYLMKNYLPQFLLENFMALEGMSTHDGLLDYTNSEAGMLYYYDVIAFMLKSNPIAYGHWDRILIRMRNQQEQQETENIKKHKKKSSLVKFFKGFLQKIIVSRDAVMHIISDWLEWKQNLDENYANLKYESYFVTSIFNDNVQWLFTIINCVCLIKINSNSNKYSEYYLTAGPSPADEPEISQLRLYQEDYFKWVTLLLMLYYYFHELQNSKDWSISKKKSQEAKIDRLMNKQKFLQKLYYVQLYKKAQQAYTAVQNASILTILAQKLDDWENFYDNHSKSSIIQYSLSYPITKSVKNKLKSKIKSFLKRKELEEREFSGFTKRRAPH